MTSPQAHSPWRPVLDHLHLLIALAGQPTLRDLQQAMAEVSGGEPPSIGKLSQTLGGRSARIDWPFVDLLLGACRHLAQQREMPVVPDDFDQHRLYRLWRRAMINWITGHPDAPPDCRYDPTSVEPPPRHPNPITAKPHTAQRPGSQPQADRAMTIGRTGHFRNPAPHPTITGGVS